MFRTIANIASRNISNSDQVKTRTFFSKGGSGSKKTKVLDLSSMEPVNKVKHENRLAKEKSPYLLQHKNNPVDW
jgi:hypothetical protein